MELETLAATKDNTTPVVPPRVIGVLEQFGHVFDWPGDLPPVRAHDHAINLQLGAIPLNMQPYRYPHI